MCAVTVNDWPALTQPLGNPVTEVSVGFSGSSSLIDTPPTMMSRLQGRLIPFPRVLRPIARPLALS
jgi:hypothetical protein